MTKVKITVLKTDFYPDLAAEYGKPELGPCAAMKVGDVFYADVKCPEGFCHTAWNCIYQYVFALANGGGREGFFYNDWSREPGVAHQQLQRRLPPRHLQAGGHRHPVGEGEVTERSEMPLDKRIALC